MPPRSKPPLPTRIKKAKSRVRKMVSRRPRENVNIQRHREVKSYLIRTYNVARSLNEWSDLMLHSLARREHAYAEHLATVSREKKWSPEYNQWLVRRLKALDRRKKFWEARLKFAKKLEWSTLNGLRLVHPSPELKLVKDTLTQKQSNAARANREWIEMKQKLPSSGLRTNSRARAKEYWEVALRQVQSIRDLIHVQNTLFAKYALTFSPHTRGVLKHQERELLRIEGGIRANIQELDREDGEGGGDYAFI